MEYCGTASQMVKFKRSVIMFGFNICEKGKKNGWGDSTQSSELNGHQRSKADCVYHFLMPAKDLSLSLGSNDEVSVRDG